MAGFPPTTPAPLILACKLQRPTILMQCKLRTLVASKLVTGSFLPASCEFVAVHNDTTTPDDAVFKIIIDTHTCSRSPPRPPSRNQEPPLAACNRDRTPCSRNSKISSCRLELERPPTSSSHPLSLSLSLWRSSIMISRPGGRSCMACLACGIPSRAPEPFPPLLHDSRWCGVAVHKSRFSLAHSVSSFLAGRRAPSSGARRDVRVLRSFR
jgi:hypothetical protein